MGGSPERARRKTWVVQQAATSLVDRAVAPVIEELMQKHDKLKRQLAISERMKQQAQSLFAKSQEDRDSSKKVSNLHIHATRSTYILLAYLHTGSILFLLQAICSQQPQDLGGSCW
jgi:hypothetical protein